MDKKQEILDNIRNELRRIEEEAIYEEKSHSSAYDIWSKFHVIFGVTIGLFSVGAGMRASQEPTLSLWLSSCAAIATVMLTLLKPDEKASGHKVAASDYQALGSKARILRVVHMLSLSAETSALAERLDLLSEERSRLHRSSPTPLAEAYRKVQQALSREDISDSREQSF